MSGFIAPRQIGNENLLGLVLGTKRFSEGFPKFQARKILDIRCSHVSEIATFRILEVWGDQLSLTLALSGLDETYPHWKAICFTLPIQMLISFRNILTYTTRWQPIPVLLPGESHRQRSLVGHSPWSRKESDMTERLHFSHTTRSI